MVIISPGSVQRRPIVMPGLDCEIALAGNQSGEKPSVLKPRLVGTEKGDFMRQIVMSAMLLLALLAVPAFGQGPTIRVNVPFEFSLDDKTYPAGEYAFS